MGAGKSSLNWWLRVEAGGLQDQGLLGLQSLRMNCGRRACVGWLEWVGCSSVVHHAPRMCDDLDSIPSIGKEIRW